MYELIPLNGQKSFNGKAKVVINENGEETLYSYNTAIMSKYLFGKVWLYKRLYFDKWTQTTGKHIAAFCGLNKEQFEALK